MDIKSAAAKAANETVERATKGFFDWIWGIFTSVLSIGFWGGLIAFVADLFFPKIGFRGWISDIMEKFGIKGMFNGLLAMLDPETAESIASFAERNIPWVGESIASMLRNAPREAILAMNDDEFEKTMRERTGVPEIAAALRGVRPQFNRFLEANRSIDPRQLTSKESITALLSSDDGRAVVGAILTGYDAAARGENGSIRQRAANAPASDMETKLPAALRAVIADQAGFATIMQNPQNRALIYRAAPLAAAAAGIRVTDPQAFTQGLTSALTPLSPPQQAAFFTALANPDQAGAAGAMMRLYYDSRVPSPALFAMVQSIDASSVQPPARDTLSMLQGRPAGTPVPTGQDLQTALTNFTQRRDAVRQMGAPTMDALTRAGATPQDQIRTIAQAVTRRNNPITAAHLTTLVGMVPPPATGHEHPAIAMLRNRDAAENLVRFIQVPSVGAENFTHLATTLLAGGGAATAGGASTLLRDIFGDRDRTNALINLHNTLGAEKFNEIVPLMAQQPLRITQIAQILGGLTAEQKAAALTFVRTLADGGRLVSGLEQLMTLSTPQQNALAGIMNGMAPQLQERLLPQLQALFDQNGQINTERLLTLLMDDDLRQALAEKTTELATLLQGRVPPTAQPLVTQRNLDAMFKLVEVIDRTTGGGDTEQAADRRNTRVIRTLVGIATGERPVGELRTLGREIAGVMNSQERVVAFREFLQSFDTTGLDARQQRVFNVLRDRWWTDNGNPGFDPRRPGQGNGDMQHPSYGDGGLAAFLANPDAARILLESMARSPDLTASASAAESLGMFTMSTVDKLLAVASRNSGGMIPSPEPTYHPDLRALENALAPVTPSPPAGAAAAQPAR